jgi:hypothetical protein
MAQGRKALPAALPKRLRLLGRVNLGYADDLLRLVGAADLEGVPIGDGDHEAKKSGSHWGQCAGPREVWGSRKEVRRKRVPLQRLGFFMCEFGRPCGIILRTLVIAAE